jgi:hypothetical protein
MDIPELVYVIIHENGSHLRSAGKVHDTWEDADLAARKLALDFKCKAWVMGFEDPRKLEPVTLPGLSS